MTAELATPIEVFERIGTWRALGVDLARPTNRSRGIGAQPLHLDFVNAELPPDYIFLYCVRADPNGGGASLIAPTDVAARLSDDARAELRRPIFSDGHVANLSNVGADINPFAVLTPGARFPMRYTGRLLHAVRDQRAREALLELDLLLAAKTRRMPLQPGELLVVDQRRALHGRDALHGDQGQLAPAQRRLLLHGFGRAASEGTAP